MSNASLSPLPSADRPDVTARLRDALLGASFTADGLLELLGAPAYAALSRSETCYRRAGRAGLAPEDSVRPGPAAGQVA
ncbi:DUF7059 domain-containing protein, partial [Streptomyces tendae]